MGMDCRVPDTSVDHIGVDRGALQLARCGIRMVLAVGDFDSVEKEDLGLIRAYADEMHVLNPVKDDTDSEKALRMAAERYKYIEVYGGLGGRLDHTLINLKLASLFHDRVTLYDDRNEVCVHTAGTYEYKAQEYRYFSLIPLETCTVTLEGMKYPLEDRQITVNDLYTTSNEITAASGVLHLKQGKAIVIRSRD